MKTSNELAKEVGGMTEKEILRQEMELLLLSSANTGGEISSMALAMTEIYDRLTTRNAIAPSIKVSLPEGKSLPVNEVADSIKKMTIGGGQSDF